MKERLSSGGKLEKNKGLFLCTFRVPRKETLVRGRGGGGSRKLGLQNRASEQSGQGSMRGGQEDGGGVLLSPATAPSGLQAPRALLHPQGAGRGAAESPWAAAPFSLSFSLTPPTASVCLSVCRSLSFSDRSRPPHGLPSPPLPQARIRQGSDLHPAGHSK